MPSSVSKDYWLLVTVEYFIVATTELQRFIFWKFQKCYLSYSLAPIFKHKCPNLFLPINCFKFSINCIRVLWQYMILKNLYSVAKRVENGTTNFSEQADYVCGMMFNIKWPCCTT